MKNPIYDIFEDHQYDPWDEKTRALVKSKVMALGIDGLVDLRITDKDDGGILVTPVFATEKDWMWYNLKYDSL